jgi:FKBP-type peptidyl-prolyl cis-trans isomerase 2
VFLYGAGSMLEEFERHLNGLKEGDAFDFSIDPKRATANSTKKPWWTFPKTYSR